MMRRLVSGIAIAAAIATSANAAAITSVEIGGDGPDYYNKQNYTTVAPTTSVGANWGYSSTGTDPGLVGGWVNIVSGTLFYNFSSLLSSASLYIGTPDAYNSITLYNGSTEVGTIDGNTATGGYNNYQFGAGLYKFSSSVAFNEVALGTTACCFETSGVVATTLAAPGPIAGAGFPALLGLLGFGLYRRQRSLSV